MRKVTRHNPRHSYKHINPHRLGWEAIVFIALFVLFAILRLYLRVEFPETYIGIAEHSCLAVEVFSIFGGGG